MAECHIIGQILGAQDFPQQTLFCTYKFEFGPNWKLISGQIEGQTQVDNPDHGPTTFWCHPIDLHFSTKGVQGWPKLSLQIYHRDSFGRDEFFGYGMGLVPTQPGYHRLEILCWRPVGGLKDEVVQFFLGGGPQLKNTETVCTGTDRYRLQTEAMGKVLIELNLIHRNFRTYGVEF